MNLKNTLRLATLAVMVCLSAALPALAQPSEIKPLRMSALPDITDKNGYISIGTDAQGQGGHAVKWNGAVELNCKDVVKPMADGKYEVMIAYTLINNGPGTAVNASFHSKVYDDATMISDWFWGMSSPITLAVGVPQTYISPMLLSPGMHTLTLNLDDGNSVAETNEANNKFTIRYNLTCGISTNAKPPDITSSKGITIGGAAGGAGGKFVPWGGSVKLSKTDAFSESNGQYAFNLSYDMENIGGTPTSPPFTNQGYADASIKTQQTALALNAGEVRQVNTQAYLPTGTHTFTLRLDATGVVAEGNESNNSFSITYSFTP